jgi:hypothetical protein
MAGERNYLRVPPDSTGKRVKLKHTAQVFYQNKTNGYEWKQGSFYTLGDGWTIHVHGFFETSISAGVLEVHYAKSSVYNNLVPTIGTNIIDQQTSTAIAQVTAFNDVFINTQHIVGYDNPEYGLEVDSFGSANIRFSEGIPQLDAFGKLRISGARQLGEYVYGNESVLNSFAKTGIGGGSITYDSLTKGVVVAIQGNATPNEIAAFTSHTYHHYIPGSSHLFMGTVSVNDPTATGAERNWGLFDVKNGFMFRLTSSGQFGVAIRNSNSGTTTSTFIAQADFNKDKVNGNLGASNPSGKEIDITKDNIYWIDVQWHGAGRVRFGTYHNGQRVVMHEYYHGNRFASPMTQTASLPICYSVVNTSATVPLQIKTWSGSVWTETDVDLQTLGAPRQYSSPRINVTANREDAWQFLFAISPREFSAGTDVNHSLYLPTSVRSFACKNTDGSEAIVDFRLAVEPVLSGLTWTQIPGTTVDVSTTGTSYSQGIPILDVSFRGEFERDTTNSFNNFQDGAVKNYADQGGIRSNTIASITKAATAVLTIAEPQWSLREGPVKSISGVTGMTQINGNIVYLKITGLQTAELYSDAALTTPINSTSFGTYVSGGTISGVYGPKFIWGVFAKKQFASTTTVEMAVSINWKEIVQ